MDLVDPFWNAGALSHPDKPWASCEDTKKGILAFRSQRSSEEELRCLGRECRQLMLWGLDYQARVVGAKPNAAEGLVEVLNSTAEYVEGSDVEDVNILQQWTVMVSHTLVEWEALLGLRILLVEEEADGEDARGEVEDEGMA
ncbi:hypothetical protein DFH28DRAFT_939445 [Melampsora americana]|nr:hypothetical protein DFH28DRAFT_939445 [Melampsora americana]